MYCYNTTCTSGGVLVRVRETGGYTLTLATATVCRPTYLLTYHYVMHFWLDLVSEPNPLRPLRDLQYGLGETVFGGCRHLEYMNIWGFNERKYYFVCLRQEAQMGFLNVFLLRFLSKVVLDIRNHSNLVLYKFYFR